MNRMVAYAGIAMMMLIALRSVEALWLRAFFLVTLGLLLALMVREVILRIKDRNSSK